MLLCLLYFRLDGFYLVYVGMEFDLEKTMDSMLEHGHDSDEDLTPVLLKER